MKLARRFSQGVVGLALAAFILAAGIGISRADAVTNPRAALNQTIHEMKVDGTSLDKVINFLRDNSGTNIVVNWKVLETVGVAKETPISMQVRELPLRKMLQLVLDQASPNTPLVFSIDSNVLQVTTQEDADKQMITKVYIVDDLIMANNNNIQAPRINLQNLTQTQTQQFGSGGSGGGGLGGSGGGGGLGGGGGGQGIFGSSSQQGNSQPTQTATDKGNELVTLIREVIRPNIWKENGGQASIRFFAGKLIVTAPASVHEAIGGAVDSGGIRFGS